MAMCNHSNRSFLQSAFSPLGILLLTAFIILAVYNSFLCDDAFITFRYATNLVSSDGPVFNPGERVEGYTNFLWMIIMAAVIKLGMAPEVCSRIISILMAAGLIALFICSNASRYEGKLAVYLFPAFLSFSAPFFIWSTGGLETAAFAFFVFTGILSLRTAGQKNDKRYSLVSSLLFVAAALSRPEGVMFITLAVLYFVILTVKRRISFQTTIIFIVPLLLLYGLYFCWRWNYYGMLLPNTYYIKDPGLHLLGYGLRYYLQFIINSSLWLPLALVSYRLIWAKGKVIGDFEKFLLVVIICYSLYVIYTGGDFMAGSRFLMPLVPILYLFFQNLIYPDVRLSHSVRGLTVVAALLLVFVVMNFYVTLHARKPWYSGGIDSIGILTDYTDKWTDVGEVIRQNSLPTDTIAVTAAGIIPYYTQLHTIDILGLIAPDVTEYRVRPGPRRPGHSVSIKPEYFFRLKPQFVIGHPRIQHDEPLQLPHATMRESKDLLFKFYSAVGLELPNHPGTYVNFWLRRDVVPRIRQNLKIYTK